MANEDTLIVELRRVSAAGQATTVLASADPVLVQAVREAWRRLIYGEQPDASAEGTEVR